MGCSRCRASAYYNFTPPIERFARGTYDPIGVGRSLLSDARRGERERDGEPPLPYDDTRKVPT